MAFNEDTRVKIPAILTLTRLGYKYLSLKGANIDEETNIFLDIFAESIKKINSDVSDDDIKRLLQDIRLELDNDDLGRKFYERLLNTSAIKLIDFENFENIKKYHVEYAQKMVRNLNVFNKKSNGSNNIWLNARKNDD